MSADVEQRAREDYDLTAEIDADRLDALLRPIDAVADEALIELSEDGFRSCRTDPANVVMTEVEAPAWYFESLDGADVKFGAAIPRLREFLEYVDGDVWMGYSKAENTLYLEAGSQRFDYGTIDPDVVSSKDPVDLDLDVELRVSPEDFREAVSYANWCADHARFEYAPGDDVLTLTAENARDKSVYRIDIEESDIVSDGAANSIFSMDFSEDVAEGLPEVTPVSLGLGEEYPFEARYDLAVNEEGESATVSLLQAPKIREE